MPNEHSISRRAVAVQMNSLLAALWKHRFEPEDATLMFRRWLRKYKPTDREIIAGYAIGILLDSERRLKRMKELMKKDIFRNNGGLDGGD